MKYPETYRLSTRLKGYDYSQPGVYYVTICVGDRECWLGEIIENKFIPSEIGKIVERSWLEIPDHFSGVRLEEFVVMPNHVHGIILITAERVVGVQHVEPLQNRYQHVLPKSIGSIIRGFKAAVTSWCRQNQYGYFHWQRNYHDRVIRDEEEYYRISNYIRNNPQEWDSDEENPRNNGT